MAQQRPRPPKVDDRTARLIAARDKLATLIAESDSGREIPGLVREYRLVLAELAGLGSGEDAGDVVDQLARRRSAKTEKGA
jgi:hypothetical protein